MFEIELFQVDAFTDKTFHGNPAAICLLSEWLNEELMQAIASENNLSETAFIIEENDGFHIRWFTPKGEVNLCGHATLASAFVLFELNKVKTNKVNFSCLGGTLSVFKKGERYTLDFPRLSYHPSAIPNDLSQLIDQPIVEAFDGELDYLIALADEHAVSRAQIDLIALKKLPKRGLVITAPSTLADYYSRCFYPRYFINEDPVTGSAHCMLAPFWGKRLNKTTLHSIQGSLRRGEVFCELQSNSVLVSGYCRWFLKGKLIL